MEGNCSSWLPKYRTENEYLMDIGSSYTDQHFRVVKMSRIGLISGCNNIDLQNGTVITLLIMSISNWFGCLISWLSLMTEIFIQYFQPLWLERIWEISVKHSIWTPKWNICSCAWRGALKCLYKQKMMINKTFLMKVKSSEK